MREWCLTLTPKPRNHLSPTGSLSTLTSSLLFQETWKMKLPSNLSISGNFSKKKKKKVIYPSTRPPTRPHQSKHHLLRTTFPLTNLSDECVCFLIGLTTLFTSPNYYITNFPRSPINLCHIERPTLLQTL